MHLLAYQPVGWCERPPCFFAPPFSCLAICSDHLGMPLRGMHAQLPYTLVATLKPQLISLRVFPPAAMMCSLYGLINTHRSNPRIRHLYNTPHLMASIIPLQNAPPYPAPRLLLLAECSVPWQALCAFHDPCQASTRKQVRSSHAGRFRQVSSWQMIIIIIIISSWQMIASRSLGALFGRPAAPNSAFFIFPLPALCVQVLSCVCSCEDAPLRTIRRSLKSTLSPPCGAASDEARLHHRTFCDLLSRRPLRRAPPQPCFSLSCSVLAACQDLASVFGFWALRTLPTVLRRSESSASAQCDLKLSST